MLVLFMIKQTQDHVFPRSSRFLSTTFQVYWDFRPVSSLLYTPVKCRKSGSDCKESFSNVGDWVWSLGWEDSLDRKWQPTPVFLPGKSHGQRSLVGYSPWALVAHSSWRTVDVYRIIWPWRSQRRCRTHTPAYGYLRGRVWEVSFMFNCFTLM